MQDKSCTSVTSEVNLSESDSIKTCPDDWNAPLQVSADATFVFDMDSRKLPAVSVPASYNCHECRYHAQVHAMCP